MSENKCVIQGRIKYKKLQKDMVPIHRANIEAGPDFSLRSVAIFAHSKEDCLALRPCTGHKEGHTWFAILRPSENKTKEELLAGLEVMIYSGDHDRVLPTGKPCDPPLERCLC